MSKKENKYVLGVTELHIKDNGLKAPLFITSNPDGIEELIENKFYHKEIRQFDSNETFQFDFTGIDEDTPVVINLVTRKRSMKALGRLQRVVNRVVEEFLDKDNDVFIVVSSGGKLIKSVLNGEIFQEEAVTEKDGNIRSLAHNVMSTISRNDISHAFTDIDNIILLKK